MYDELYKDPWSFTQPWFMWHLHLFHKYLSPYIGKPAHFLEIGSFEGMSSIWMLCRVLYHPQSRLTCIDPWIDAEEIEKRFWINIKHIPASKYTVIKEKSEDALVKLNSIFDFIYIDGCHTDFVPYYDAQASWRLLAHGGIMAFDDYRWPQADVQSAVDKFLSEYDSQLEVLEKDYQVWIRKK